MELTHSQTRLLNRIRITTALFMLGLILSGATAIPLSAELNWLVDFTGARQMVETPGSTNAPEWALWLMHIRAALESVSNTHPFLFYGTDWLAFGHFVIAIAFIGALRDPVRNEWLFTFGQIACVLVVPYAFVFGAIREIPVWWRLVDSSFGVLGLVPLIYCRTWVRRLVELEQKG